MGARSPAGQARGWNLGLYQDNSGYTLCEREPVDLSSVRLEALRSRSSLLLSAVQDSGSERCLACGRSAVLPSGVDRPLDLIGIPQSR